MAKITLNEALIDWVTLTTWSGKISEAWYEWVLSEVGKGVHHKIQQYEGMMVNAGNVGSIFHGFGYEVNADGLRESHYILRASGAISERAFNAWSTHIASGACKVTRIDIQVTILEPEGWSQVELMRRAEDVGMKPEIRRSRAEDGGELITVYTGTRAYGKLNRTYEKEADFGQRLLRFETEHLREFAQDIGAALARGRVTKEQTIAGEIYLRRSVDLWNVFNLWKDGKHIQKGRTRKVSSGTEKWLWNVCLPALNKYLNSHDRDESLVESFRKVINDTDRF